jgi:hypothetical protein
MTFRRCVYRSAEWRDLRDEGYKTVAVNSAGIALLLLLDEEDA